MLCVGQAAGTATDDYLATFIVKEFVDAEAETMEQVRGGAWIITRVVGRVSWARVEAKSGDS